MSAESGAVLQLTAALHALAPMPGVFNPWRDYDPVFDRASGAPAVRTAHLSRYLEARQARAKLVLVGEAPGYQGCRFSGIAMTSERMLRNLVPGVPSDGLFSGPKQPTSHPKQFPLLATEPTATIVWRCLLGLGLSPADFLFWNAFPLHPHKLGQPLTNRQPTAVELGATSHILPAMLSLASGATVVAVGKVAQRVLAGHGLRVPAVRHPANGGATLFRQQMQDIVESRSS